MVSTGARWSLVAATAFGMATVPVVGFIGPMFGTLPTLAIPLSAMATGGVLWFSLVEARETPPVRSGAVAGLLTGLLSHFAYWLFLHPTRAGSTVLSTHTQPQLFESIIDGLSTAVLSIAFIGWLSAPLGLIAGVIVGSLRKRST